MSCIYNIKKYLKGEKVPYNQEYLNQMTIYSLRKLARELGVKSPSAMRKEKIISNILDLQKGKLQPYKTKRGRPLLKSSYAPVKEKILSKQERKKLKTIKNKLESILLEIKEILTEK